MAEISEYRKKFLEAEELANELVQQLESLKKESGSYKNANNILETTQEKLAELILTFTNVVSEEKRLIETIKEIGTEKVISTIIETKDSLSENQQKFVSLTNELKEFFIEEKYFISLCHNRP